MTMIRQIEVLCRQHDELRVVVASYVEQLARAEPDLAALSKCRWTLTRLVTAHLAYEDTHLYPALQNCGAQAASLGQRMNADHGGLYCSFQANVREWTMSRIADDWPGYRRSASDLLASLRARMDREENELYPLLVVAKAA